MTWKRGQQILPKQNEKKRVNKSKQTQNTRSKALPTSIKANIHTNLNLTERGKLNKGIEERRDDSGREDKELDGKSEREEEKVHRDDDENEQEKDDMKKPLRENVEHITDIKLVMWWTLKMISYLKDLKVM